MRTANVPADVINTDVAATSFNDQIILTAWYDGQQTAGPLPVSAYSFSWDADRRVQGQATFIIADPDGNLWPRRITDALGVAGSRLHATYRYGATGHQIPLGWWRIRRTIPNVKWQWRNVAGRNVWLPSGGTITVEADEETATLELATLDIGHRQPLDTHVLQEVARIAQPLPITTDPTVTNAPMPDIEEHDANRLTAIEALLARVGATYRMGQQGALEIVPITGTPADWRIEPGENGTLVALVNSMSDERLVNAATIYRDNNGGTGGGGGGGTSTPPQPGPQGPAGTIVSATATQLPPGAQPTITLGGTPQARTMEFGIPQGQPGPAADQNVFWSSWSAPSRAYPANATSEIPVNAWRAHSFQSPIPPWMRDVAPAGTALAPHTALFALENGLYGITVTVRMPSLTARAVRLGVSLSARANPGETSFASASGGFPAAASQAGMDYTTTMFLIVATAEFGQFIRLMFWSNLATTAALGGWLRIEKLA